MKNALILLILIGMLMGALHQSGRGTGIQVVDSNIAALDVSLREYIQVIEGYLAGAGDAQADGAGFVNMLGSAVDAMPNSTASESDQSEDESNDAPSN